MKFLIKKTLDYRGVLGKCYCTDPAFIGEYHSLKGAIDVFGAIEREYSCMVKMSKSDRYSVFEIFDGESFCGYFGLERMGGIECLAGFFILPEYRTKAFIYKFWKVVKSKFKKEINCILYTNNTRAISFIKKAGFKQRLDTFEVNGCNALLFVK